MFVLNNAAILVLVDVRLDVPHHVIPLIHMVFHQHKYEVTMSNYLLTLVFNDGEQREVLLARPHEVTTTGIKYVDRDGLIHHIPFSSLKETIYEKGSNA